MFKITSNAVPGCLTLNRSLQGRNKVCVCVEAGVVMTKTK